VKGKEFIFMRGGTSANEGRHRIAALLRFGRIVKGTASAARGSYPQGHILLNTGMPSFGPVIVESIRKLGFKPADIKIIINGHGHSDHAGAFAFMGTRRVFACVRELPSRGGGVPSHGGERDRGGRSGAHRRQALTRCRAAHRHDDPAARRHVA
jgi:Metallo-beta-lactamase superfamily